VHHDVFFICIAVNINCMYILFIVITYEEQILSLMSSSAKALCKGWDCCTSA
jgi:hypothetical protein